MTRHDIPETVRPVITTATIGRYGLDMFDIYAIAMTHKNDWDALVEELIAIAFTNIHLDGGKEYHEAVVKSAEEYWASK